MQTVECPTEYLSPEDLANALAAQLAINEGTAWRLEGSYGREMMFMIENGYCLLGPNDARDYYGNHIPSRTQVKEGTKGSYEFVKNLHGEHWADLLIRSSEESSA